ncbi:MAG: serine/threonine protein kinase [Chloroflexi bacterium]|nr:serine/threonine protein kinase [Chloroflexota bacterium]
MPDIDQILQNRYRIVSPVKRGGMGAIYRAWDTRLNVTVALKEMIPQPVLDAAMLSQFRQQFQQEATTLARLDHPHLVGVTDFFEEEGSAYLVMKFIEGDSLAERIERQGALPEEEVMVWADQLLDTLIYCHNQGVLHRDIKPQNVIIRPDGRAVLVDFGLVKLWDPNAPQTRTAVRGAGTPEYAPPEQYDAGTGHTDPRSDIYGLGATLYHAIIGRAPPTATQRIVNPAALVPVRTANPRVSSNSEQALMRALELQPDSRFWNATEMRLALRGTTSHLRRPSTGTRVIAGYPTSGERKAPLWARIVKAIGIMILIVALLGAAAVGGIWLFGDRTLLTSIIGQPTATLTSEPTPEPAPTETDTPTPSPPPQPTDTLEPTSTFQPTATSTPTPTATPTSTPTATPTPEAAAVVLDGGAQLRPGADTWWNVRRTLSADTVVELAGYDPNFPDWVYVSTLDESASGWTQIENLQINRDLDNLPPATPRPTLTPTGGNQSPTSPPSSTCTGGTLTLDAWETTKTCVSGGWTAVVYAEGRGGNCSYTYFWQGQLKGGPTSSSVAFEVIGGGGSTVGTVMVTSGGQTATRELFISGPDCD